MPQQHQISISFQGRCRFRLSIFLFLPTSLLSHSTRSAGVNWACHSLFHKVLVVHVAKVFEVEHEGLHPLEGIPQIVSRSSPSQAMQPWLCWASTASLIPPPRRVENWVEVLRMVAVPAALVPRSAHQCMQAVQMPILPLLGNTFRGGMQGCLHISNI